MPIDFCKSSPEAHLRPGSLPANSLDWSQCSKHNCKRILISDPVCKSYPRISFLFFEMAGLAVPQVWHYTSRYCYCMIY